ncbi:MAG: hypothetical protein AAF334_06805 [Pseudomonadota bacterium]
MLLYRIICAILMAWGVNWSLSRDEADLMLKVLPEMATLSPVAAAFVGYFNLAVRQGWGFIVSFANGIWAGVLAILLSGVLFVVARMAQGIQTDNVQSFDNFLAVFSSTMQPLLDEVANVPLLTVSLGASALIGVVTEVIHWVLVRMRQRKGGGQRVN